MNNNKGETMEDIYKSCRRKIRKNIFESCNDLFTNQIIADEVYMCIIRELEELLDELEIDTE